MNHPEDGHELAVEALRNIPPDERAVEGESSSSSSSGLYEATFRDQRSTREKRWERMGNEGIISLVEELTSSANSDRSGLSSGDLFELINTVQDPLGASLQQSPVCR